MSLLHHCTSLIARCSAEFTLATAIVVLAIAHLQRGTCAPDPCEVSSVSLTALTPMLPYADMNLGDAPLVEGPALAPGSAPAPQALISAAIAAEEAPTPQEKAVTNPLTNVISALLTGRRLQQQPGPQQPGPQQQQPQPAAGNAAL